MEEVQDREIDIKAIVFKLSKYWKLFTLSIFISLVGAFIVDQSTNPEYVVKASVYVNSPNSSLDASTLLFSSELSASPEQVTNQSIIIKSFPLLNKVFDKLDFSVSYFRESFYREEELYRNKPFTISLGENAMHIPYGNAISIVFSDEHNFHLVLDGKDPITDAAIFYEGEFNVGQTIDINGCTFSLARKADQSITLNQAYSFVFNNPNELLYNYYSTLLVEVERESASIIKLKLEGSQTDKLIDFLNHLLEIYLENNLAEKNEAISNSITFMEREIELIADSLAILDKQLEEFKSSNQINNIDLEVELILKELSDLENEKTALKLRENYFDYLIESLNDNSGYSNFRIPSTAGIDDPILSNLISQLINYARQRKSIIQAGKSESPLLSSIESNIKSLKAEILENVSSLNKANSISQTLINNNLQEVKRSASRLPAVEKELIDLTRSYKLYENLYLLLQQNKTEAEVLRSENKADFKIIEPARLESLEPTISRKIYYILGIGIGFIIAFILFIIKLIYTDRIESIRELDQLEGIPFLGAISKVNSWTVDYISRHPKSKFAETIRILISNIGFMTNRAKDSAIKLMINSVGSGEGKSYMCTNLSILLSFTGKKIVIIDADLRSPSVGEIFNHTSKSGISHYLNGTSTIEDIIVSSKFDNLDLILSSAVPPNPSDLLSSSNFQALLETLEKKYDYIIIDTPPMGLVVDPLIISKHVDANIIVLREDYSRLSYLEVIKRLYKQERLGNSGVVLNDSGSAFKHTYSEKYYIDDLPNRTFASKVRSIFRR